MSEGIDLQQMRLALKHGVGKKPALCRIIADHSVAVTGTELFEFCKEKVLLLAFVPMAYGMRRGSWRIR